MDCRQYKEINSAHIDEALSSEERPAVQSHLSQCSRCTQMFLWETGVTRAIKAKLSLISARPALKERVLDQLRETPREGLFGWSYMAHGLTAVFALLLIVAVPYLFWSDHVEEDIYTDAMAQYQNVAQGITQGIKDNQQAASPAVGLLDLRPWGYRILSRQIQQIMGQEGRVFVYQGPGKEYLLAQEIKGVEFSHPSGGTVIRASSRNFVSYSQQGVNLIAWKQKDILCILTSTLPKEKLLSLALQISMDT